MRWVMVTRKLDPRDDRAGFVVRWVEELAARLENLDVICQESAAPDLPDNVRVFSMGKESGAGRVAQARRFTAHLRALVPGADGVFCHMIPRYVLFAAPWARLYRKPLLFWYTHRQISLELRLAHFFPTRILTAAPGSYPIPTSRLAVIGHGIETDLFPPPDGESDPPEVIQVARLSPIKRQDDLLRAAAVVRAARTVGSFRVVIVGGAVEVRSRSTRPSSKTLAGAVRTRGCGDVHRAAATCPGRGTAARQRHHRQSQPAGPVRQGRAGRHVRR